jgi:exopolyphosphatase/guanosine-5'-triphosphate,3'-diphosphate pyrophosphatase
LSDDALRFDRPRAAPTAATRSAIIDIGSNSVRLVVYQGPPRLPAIIFNEKVMAGLGRGLSEGGEIDAAALDRAVKAIRRFAAIAREMEVEHLRAVATAAVREASNGPELVAHARDLGVFVELLSGEQEALAAGLGVLSAIPEADGIVGDLGGGSLELARVAGGEVQERVSFPLGVLRVAAIRAKGKGSLNRFVARALASAGWAGAGIGLPFYMVGGTWRALARLDMHLRLYPLPAIHGYTIPTDAIGDLRGYLSEAGKEELRQVPGLSSARAANLADGAALLAALMKALGSETVVASAYGLREGLLFAALESEVRAEDPLLVAAREEGRRQGRFPEHGDLLDRWIAPLFAKEPPTLARLRHAACLLADTGWSANPEFRAERGVEIALHGNWVGVDGAGRALIAQALHTSLGGELSSPAPLEALAGAKPLETAMRWGLAMRLGQRLSGGVAGPLERSALALAKGKLTLALGAGDEPLYGETVERRHRALAQSMKAEPALA